MVFDNCIFEQLYLKAYNLKHIIFKREILVFLEKSKALKYKHNSLRMFKLYFDGF